MIGVEEIKKKALSKYTTFLESVVNNENIFPLIISGNKKPSKSTKEFDREIRELLSNSKEQKGYGFTIAYETRKSKILGTQSFPSKFSFESEIDYLKFLNKTKEVALFREIKKETFTEFSELKTWMLKYPKKIISNKENWDAILKVCRYFKKNPIPNLYVRELPIQVHTKFIERHKGIIKDLLDILIEDYVNFDASKFEERFNLKFSEPLIRFRVLDSKISEKVFSGISDLSIPVSQFRSLKLKIKRIIIVENKVNLYNILTLPNTENTIVIFGKGYSVSNLKNIEWFNDKEILYWGDIDAQGFEILSQVRSYYPQVQSVLMDTNTFTKFYENDLGTISLVKNELNLTKEEGLLYNRLKAENLRLEQEKIPHGYVINFFNNL
ncbi:hypothetical protein IMCC3317_17600 [Kordia antarctica]|uniref:Wadjet protein JetD C-terminal domain-containing protein n=1 Tax=Kordia antarctica TaxID=1218801 RepID=A0A7L4ZIT7_9FLAO|nr:Wadjet anti-phage system protein JetD domain-containing protein [Kordia antarctica]QHI36397.1 hypothetical protein IMCC3317_17600 [Kordia antarctica]